VSTRDRDRDRDHDRDYRRRSRDRDYRERRDGSRDRQQRRDDSNRNSRPRDGEDRERTEQVRTGSDMRALQDVSPSAQIKETEPPQQTEEDKKAERLAKLEAWKLKQAEEKTRKQTELASGSSKPSVNLLDNKATASPATAGSSPRSSLPPGSPHSPAAFSGKFDPKAIAKKATANAAAASNALGADVALPKGAGGLNGAVPTTVPGAATSKTSVYGSQSKPLKNVGAFGLGKTAQSGPDKSHRGGLNLEEEVSTRKTLEKLPTQLAQDMPAADTELADNAEEDQDDDEDMAGADNEEDEAAAARAAAEKRDERIAAQSLAESAGLDVTMTDAPEAAQEEEEEIDPLDAFMSGLSDPLNAPKAPGLRGIASKKGKQKAPEAMFSDDEEELAAMDEDAEGILDIAVKARKKKEIPVVNHAKMNYDSFRKNFYTEPLELANMTEEELADLRLELDGIKVRGIDAPKPVTSWPQCGLGVQTLDVIQKLGYEKPTAIQAQAIPSLMSGRDVIGIAKTGSGKTVAFLLPMFRHIKDQKALGTLDGPIGLIMSPTRELATQIHKECRPWLKALNLRAVCAYGGAPIKDQIAELKRGAEIVVCTPGRMIDLLAANNGRVTNLRRVTYAVLDEADRMFDMGFEPQVMKILGNIRPGRQLVLFSATFPKNMEALARKALKKPVEIIVGGRSVVAPEIKQIVEVRADTTKFMRLLQLLGEVHQDEDARSLVFVDKQESAEDLMAAILKKGYPCFTIHGGKDQYDRDSVISDFKAGIFPVLVATSVAARGLDVKQLKMVVNFDCPNHLEDYVHRAGRTGRAGQKGLAVTFITEEQARYAVDIVKALKQSEQEVPEDLQKLASGFLEKVKEGKEKASGSGFGGKGLDRLDKDRDAAKARERGIFKTEDDDDDSNDKDKKEVDLKDIIAKATGETTAAPAAAAPSASSADGDAAKKFLPAGFSFDAPIQAEKYEAAPAPAKPADRLRQVSSVVDAINSRLRKSGEVRNNTPIDNKGPDAGAFHFNLTINDFPQKARWGVTNRSNVAKILEATGTSITSKGIFYPPGKEPAEGEQPKLYLLVEGDTDVAVQNAVRELMRLLKEGVQAAVDDESRTHTSGRYSVV